MSKGLSRPQGLPHSSSFVESVYTKGGIIFLFSGVLACSSLALIREEGKIQKSVYYTSQALRGAEGRYPMIEKLAFALVTAFRKLWHYFQAHVINVLTDHPLKNAMLQDD